MLSQGRRARKGLNGLFDKVISRRLAGFVKPNLRRFFCFLFFPPRAPRLGEKYFFVFAR